MFYKTFQEFLNEHYPGITIDNYHLSKDGNNNDVYNFKLIYKDSHFDISLVNKFKPPMSFQFEEELRNNGITYP